MNRLASAFLAGALAVSTIAVTTAEASPPDVKAQEDIPPGFDLFETDPQRTVFKFQGLTAIPAGFFGPGSQPFQGQVPFAGDPLNRFQGHDIGDADTVVRRTAPADVPGPGSSATVPIELVELNLVSVQPITVHVGNTTEQWDVKAVESPTLPSQGQIFIHRTETGGGTFDTQLLVLPLFTFTGPRGKTRILDLAGQAAAQTGLRLSYTGVPWRTGCALPSLDVPALSTGFCPGLTPTRQKREAVGTALFAQHAILPAQPRLEHFACYSAEERGRRFQRRGVRVSDQFGSRRIRVVKPARLCNPARKNREPFVNGRVHLKCYFIDDAPFRRRTVMTRDQFGPQRLRVEKPRDLCVPTLKRLLKPTRKPTISGKPNPLLVDSFLCYRVSPRTSFRARRVLITDQFGKLTRTARTPVALCNPGRVASDGSNHPVRHLVCYLLTEKRADARSRPRLAQTSNRLGREVLHVTGPRTLCVPSVKVEYQ